MSLTYKEQHVSKLKEFIESGDLYIIAMPRFKEFIKDMMADFPKGRDYETSGQIHSWTPSVREDYVNWKRKWVGIIYELGKTY